MAATPPVGFIEADRQLNPGWWYDPNGDPNQPSTWWEQVPLGWVEDPNAPGWYLKPNSDPNLPESWWYEGRIQEPQPPAQPEGHWYDPAFARARELYGRSPYQFGGDRIEGRSDGGYDCIGYVMELLDACSPPLGNFRLGIAQGYINAERARQACTPVPYDKAQPGDLIFFQGTYPTKGASHVGMILDPAAHIMSDDHDRGNGTGPGETKYSENYWQGHFLSVGRVPR